jgi:hypothetical protein
LNPFIAHFNRNDSTFETINTGGITEIRVLNASPLASYAFFLEDFREGLYNQTRAFWLTTDKFIQALEPLLKFYVDTINTVERQQGSFANREELIKGIIKPASRFLKTVDESLGTQFLIERAEKLKLASPTLKFQITNFSRYGIPELQLKVSSVVAPVFGEYSRVIPLFAVNTDSSGNVTFKLTQGCYDFEVSRYKKLRFEVKDNVTLKINVYDFGRLFRQLLRIPYKENNEPYRQIKQEKTKKLKKRLEEGQTITKENKNGLKFVVPKEVYSNPEYREYLNHAESMKSVKVIVDEFYSKHGKRDTSKKHKSIGGNDG